MSRPPGKTSAPTSNGNTSSGGGGGWGSLFSSAITGLESRLDNILADDPDALAKQRSAQQNGRPRAGSGNLAPGTSSRNRSASGSRERSASRDGERPKAGGGDRLAERLARATAQKKMASGVGVGVKSEESARNSVELRRSGEERRSGEIGRTSEARRSGEVIRETPEPAAAAAERTSGMPGNGIKADVISTENDTGVPSTLLSSELPINPARHSLESSTRPSVDLPSRDETNSSRQSTDLANGAQVEKTNEQLEAEMAQMHVDHEQAEKLRQEKMHANMERIDALQAKLRYLAKETVAAAKEANAAAPFGSTEAKLAEKDEQIALLMGEGEALSKKELRHLQTIKQLRARTMESEKAAAVTSEKLATVERSEGELKQKLRRAEAAQRQSLEESRRISGLEKQVQDLIVERDKASESVTGLTSKLRDAEKRALQASRDVTAKGSDVDKAKIADLENELEDAQIEKQLAEDRAKAETRKLRDELDRHRDRSSMRDLEVKNEIAGYDSRLEAMRARAEEASSEGGVTGESSAKLLRQIETLQSQYSHAKGNWETIESSLNARLSTLEQERDESNKREAEVRKKARDLTIKSRKAEDQVESLKEHLAAATAESKTGGDRLSSVQRELTQVQTALAEAKADSDRQRRVFDSELVTRLEEEKARWQRSMTPLRTASPTTLTPSTSRKPSFPNPHRPAARLASPDLTSLHLARRNSTQPPHLHTVNSPSLSRQESILSFSVPPTPDLEQEPDFDPAEPTPHPSPQNTVADLMSTSTSAAGPSVQLVSRMSAAVRRLEGEKSSFKDELSLLRSQRDEARGEIVALMREVEGVRGEGKRIEELEKQLSEVRRRYEACLQLVGEREEEVEELKADVVELKGLYRELVEKKVGGGS
ncbi:hypothetical protein B0A48_02800 [Cryoendolithus antarcticus]|uniref:TATA element modulatory factor 1 TATA binding domain-containing protein n=1 Tax=Cryoendolithus antarcticus TaxID=1507870 RepID=A0A1V8TLB6_9PEZI|nr:hypothetical protein B0A48_02800 [Cryoendolithus antarcticus]